MEAALRALDSAQTATSSALANHAQQVQVQMDSMKTDINHGVGLVQGQVDSLKDDMSKVINAVTLMSSQFNEYVASVAAGGGSSSSAAAAAAASSSSSSARAAATTGAATTTTKEALVSLVNTKGLRRPSCFDHSKGHCYKTWVKKFTKWVNSTFSGVKPIIEKCVVQALPVDLKEVASANGLALDVVEHWATQIDTMLSSFMEDEAFEISESTDGNGFEGLRLLKRRFNPTNPIASSNLLDAVLQVKSVPQAMLLKALSAWEGSVKDYRKQSGQDINDE